MKTNFINNILSIIIILLLITVVVLLFDNYSTYNETTVKVESILNRIDSLNNRYNHIKIDILSKLDSISVSEQITINKYEQNKNAIIDGSISDDSLTIFISSEIHNRRKDLLLLHP